MRETDEKKTARPERPKVRRSPMEHPRHQYPEATRALQQIARSCGLTETIKWGKPCFVAGDRNIVLIQRFNEYLALMFFKGALLQDPKKLLHRIGKMQGPRQLRFRDASEVQALEETIAAYIREAMEMEASGTKLPTKNVAEVAMPEELQTALDGDAKLRAAFDGLTPGRQKQYIFEIAAAKQASTRAARVQKYAPGILAGKGLRDAVTT